MSIERVRHHSCCFAQEAAEAAAKAKLQKNALKLLLLLIKRARAVKGTTAVEQTATAATRPR
jgi:hypothetical protein